MKLLQTLSVVTALLVVSSLPAFASITVSSPYNNSTVGTTFTLSANANNCSNQAISAMGYSLDGSTQTTIVYSSAINRSVSASAGGHTLHVKAWGNQGASCVSDVAITVSTSTSSSDTSSSSSTTSSSGDPSIASPANGASVSSPFSLSASSANCSGQPTSAIGYSVDNSSYTYIVNSTVLNTSVTTGAGGHTIHVKSWGNGGAVCVNNLAVTVGSTTTATPSSATNLSNLQATTSWSAIHDSGTGGSSSGWSGVTSSPSRTGSARHFSTSYSNYGGERYMASFSDDTSAHNFVYDGWVYIQNSATGVANLETDLNQVIGNGWTVIMGFQCDGWSGTWDYTVNGGSATSPNDHWVHSWAKCNPRNWGVNAWHHLQIAFSRDDYGNVTYQSVTLDGNTQTLNAKVFSGFALGWSKTMITNFQVDGGTSYSSGSNIYLDDLTISRW
jgi:hypothetical protein